MLREKRGEMVLKMLHLCVLMAANLNKDSLRDGNHNILGILCSVSVNTFWTRSNGK